MKIHRYIYLTLQALTLVVLAFMLSGCGSKQATADLQVEPAKRPVSEFVREDVEYVMDRTYDPLEPINRRIYRFNYHFDRLVFLPLVRVYSFILPEFAENGVSNFFNNVREIKNFYNNVLQLQGKAAADTAARFGINTTLGILGLWDPATRMCIRRHPEDFGQTLGHYGVGNGPFLVLPILGPSNLRDTTGLIADSVAMDHIIYKATLDDALNVNRPSRGTIKITAKTLNALDTRYRTGFRYYGSGSPFEYELVKMFYTEMRNMSINKH